MQPQHPVLVTALSILSLTCASCAAPPGDNAGTAPGETTEHADDGDVVGAVRFETSCAPKLQATFDRAVATLHSFEFGEARDLFEAIASEDPDCGMAAWGVAMTRAPRRFNTYAGAARAAMATGETAVAHDYYQKLLELAADASTRPKLAEARDSTT